MNENKSPKYELHLILNHASPDAQKRLARNTRVKLPSLNRISTTKKDITYRRCMNGKLRCAPHRRATHNYERGEAVSTDIMGPLNKE